MCEVFKLLNYLKPFFMREFFEHKGTPYAFRRGSLMKLPFAKGKTYGILLFTISC